jgi:hypothetical protein
VQAIADKLGFTLDRVQSHVNYEVDKGRASIDRKGRVIVDEDNQPNYRNEE